MTSVLSKCTAAGQAKSLILATCLLAVGCVEGEQTSTRGFSPKSGLPDDAVVGMSYLNDGEGRDHRTILLTYIVEKASKSQIATAPQNLCASIGKTPFHTEYLASPPYHLGRRTEKLMVRCQ